ncbi:MAG TPA: GLUG motif-containing protein [Rhizomicrobium sp.]|nr:GLUG motif-containing protein [Rhizomicrobium sp.]
MLTRSAIAGPLAGLVLICLSSGADAQLIVSSGPTKGVTCSSGVCTTTTARAVLNVQDLQNELADFDVRLVPGTMSKSIAINADVFWSSPQRLTLDSFQGIAIARSIQVTGTGAITLTTNDGGSDGSITYAGKGNIGFLDLSSSLIVDGVAYTLESSIAGLASAIAGNSTGHYALAGNYDASADGSYSASPIPTVFGGTFEGLHHTISGLKIAVSTTGGNVGLFSSTSSSAAIRDLVLYRIVVDDTGGQGPTVGGLVGQNDGLISNVVVSGSVEAQFGTYIGGLVGHAVFDSQIFNAKSSAGVFGITAGSLVGNNQGGVIKFSAASGRVTMSPSASSRFGGGLVGNNNGGDIEQSYATGIVRGPDATVLGGLAGQNADGGIIKACFATGATKDGMNSDAAGLVGYNFGQIIESYATGAPKAKRFSRVGGVIGDDFTFGDGSVTTTYWDMTTSGITNPGQGAGNPSNDPGLTGLTDAQLTSGLPGGFESAIWQQNSSINHGWPYLTQAPLPPKS